MKGFFRSDDPDRVPDVGLSPYRIAEMLEQCKELESQFRVIRRRFGEYDDRYRSEPSLITQMLDERQVMEKLNDIRAALGTLATVYGCSDRRLFLKNLDDCDPARKTARKTWRQYEDDKTRERHEDCP